MSEKPISPLRQRMHEDMNMRRFVPDTQREYIRAVKRLAILGRSPDAATAEELRKSRIGQYGDKLMEDDYRVGQIMDALKELGVDDNTLLVFASDNGPQGHVVRELGNHGTPDTGSPGPFRSELGEVTEGSIRTFCFIRWPGQVEPDTSSYAMFSFMDFPPTPSQNRKRRAPVLFAAVQELRPVDYAVHRQTQY
jgi:arylsulfatase A-like enzyme